MCATNFRTQNLTLNSQNVRATGNNLYVNGAEIGAGISGNLGLTGQALIARDLQISGALQALITASDSDVNSINGQQGTLVVTGTGYISVISGGAQLIIVSGNDNDARNLSGNLALTGQITLTHAQNNAINLSGRLFVTGSTLDNKINSVSGWADNSLVHKVGDENISGSKTFFSPIKFSLGGTEFSEVGPTGFRSLVGLASVDLANNFLTDTNGIDSVIWFGRLLKNTANQTSLDWQNRILSGEWIVSSTGNDPLTIINHQRLSGFSGQVLSQIIASGKRAWDDAVNLSGRLFATGSFLDNKINSLSGQVDGVFVHRTGNEIISGDKTWSGNAYFVSGNVGMGTTTPMLKLHVLSSGVGGPYPTFLSERDVALFEAPSGQNANIVIMASRNNTSNVDFADNDARNAGLIQYSHITNDLLIYNNGGISRMAILSGGNVGIGTTAPTNYPTRTVLDISGPAGGNGGLVQVKTEDGSASGYFLASNGGTITLGSVNAGNLQFRTNAAVRATISPSGDVGVGTTAPSSKLHIVNSGGTAGPQPTWLPDRDTLIVEGFSGSNSNVVIFANRTNASNVTFADNDSRVAGAIAYSHATNSLSFRVNEVSDRVVIDSGGNMGIGTTTPAALLDIASHTLIRGNLTGFGGQYSSAQTISKEYSILPTDHRIYFNNTTGIRVLFPSAVTASGQEVKIKLINTGQITLTGTHGQFFDGLPSIVQSGRYFALEAHSDGANWYLW